MIKKLDQRLLNLIVRSASLLGKLILLAYLSIFESPEVLGAYGLIISFSLYILFFAAFDLYVFANKELLIAESKHHKNSILTEQVIFGILTLTISSVVLWGVIDFLPFGSDVLFFLTFLIYVEYFNQEAFRIFVVLERQISASVNLLIRSSLWVPIAILIIHNTELSSIDVILLSWISGAFFSLLYSLKILCKENLKFTINREILCFPLIRKGFSNILMIFVGTLSFKAITVLDKFILENNSGLAIVGVYVLYQSVFNAFMTIIDSTVLSFSLPKVLKSKSSFHITDFVKKIEKKVFIIMIGLLLIFSFSLVLMGLMNVGNYYTSSYLFICLIALGSTVTILTLPNQQALYALSAYRAISLTKVFSFVAFVISSCIFNILSIDQTALSIPISVLLSSIVFYVSTKFFILKIAG